jgi:hypothetical protein
MLRVDGLWLAIKVGGLKRSGNIVCKHGVRGAKVAKVIQRPDAQLGLISTGLVSGIFSVAMVDKDGVSKEPFIVAVGPDDLDDDGAEPTGAIVPRCLRGGLTNCPLGRTSPCSMQLLCRICSTTSANHGTIAVHPITCETDSFC